MAGKLQGIYPEKLFSALSAGKVAPVYYLVGDDRFEKTKVREKLLAVLKPGEDSVHRLTGQEVRAGDIEGLANTLSLFGGNRLIWIEDAHRIGASEKKVLGEYVQSPNPSTCVVFASDEWKTDPGDPLMAGAHAAGGLVHFRAPTGDRLSEWVSRHAKDKGFTLSPEGLERLIAEAGEDRQILDQELQRLALYKKGGTASEADVVACLGYTETQEIWDVEKSLSAAMAERTKPARAEAVRLIEKLLQEGEEPVKVSNYVSYAVQHLMAARRLIQAGYPPTGIKMKVRAWGNDDVAAHAMRIPDARLLRGLQLCLDTELKLKSGAAAPELEVRELVLRLTA